MIRELSIQNFRSIRNATLELGRFSVLTGANNSGKSSVLYALQVLKNVVSNPNRSVDELLNLGFLNLGGLKEATWGKQESNQMYLGTKSVSRSAEIEVEYKWYLASQGALTIKGNKPFHFSGMLPVTYPNALNFQTEIPLTRPSDGWYFVWDGYKNLGVSMHTGSSSGTGSPLQIFDTVQEMVKLPINTLNSTSITPTSRGFTKPIFNTTPLDGSLFTEDEVATLLAIDRDVQAKVAFYFEKITGKRFSVSIQPGMGFFYLQVREADSTFSTELVNQGQGFNQIIFLLAKILYSKNRLIGIDEPEIHLHPTLMEQFVRVLVEIAKEEDKQFVFSTHSEHWLMSLLAEVYEGHLSHEDLKVYYLQKEGQETTVEAQQVQPNGQLEGGLKNFLDAQMHLTSRFFAATTV